MRGLKRVINQLGVCGGGSHPTRVRGLKLDASIITAPIQVAPHTGAWIETRGVLLQYYPCAVAPHTGAWIETPNLSAKIPCNLSHPTRVRGLKHKANDLLIYLNQSHPTRVRGLKLLSLIKFMKWQSRTPHGCVD